MKAWEYLEIVDDHSRRYVGNGLNGSVIDAGRDGWELVTVIPEYQPEQLGMRVIQERWIFKRESLTTIDKEQSK